MTDTSAARVHQLPSQPQFEVLLIEDNPGHVRLLQEAITETASELSLHSVENGDAALDELHDRLQNDEASLPDIVLVDLHLPGQNGHEVIESIKAHPDLLSLPTIVLTSSVDGNDVARCYQHGANAFLTKPTELDGLISLVEAIEAFWFGAARLPQDSS